MLLRSVTGANLGRRAGAQGVWRIGTPSQRPRLDSAVGLRELAARAYHGSITSGGLSLFRVTRMGASDGPTEGH